MPWDEFSQTVKLLALISRAKPEVFDVFPPYDREVLDRLDAVALNPQPLPPRDPLVIGAILMSRRLVQLAVEADVRGDEPAEWLGRIIEEWCGTPWPSKWPWPGPGPGPEDGPFPDPWAVSQARTMGAVVLASTAARLGAGDLRDVLATSAERLAEAAAHEM
jgi:hypothetical protein